MWAVSMLVPEGVRHLQVPHIRSSDAHVWLAQACACAARHVLQKHVLQKHVLRAWLPWSVVLSCWVRGPERRTSGLLVRDRHDVLAGLLLIPSSRTLTAVLLISNRRPRGHCRSAASACDQEVDLTLYKTGRYFQDKEVACSEAHASALRNRAWSAQAWVSCATLAGTKGAIKLACNVRETHYIPAYH